MEGLQNQFNESLYTIVGLLISLATIYIVIYLNKLISKAKIEATKIENEQQRKLVIDGLEDLRRTLVKNIVATEETTKQAMIKSKQGNLTKEDYKKLAEEVLIKTKDQLSNDTLSLLSRNYDNLDSYIKSELEEQLKQVKKLGPLENMLKLIPGASKMGLNNITIDPKQIAHIEAIIQSMTIKERQNPDIMKASRKIRIANGSGTSVQEVNKLLNQFDQMKKMMKMMKNGNFKMPF